MEECKQGEIEIKEKLIGYNKIFDNNPMAMALFHILKDEDGKYTSYVVEYMNNAMRHLVGDKADYVVGSIYTNEYPVHKELLLYIMYHKEPLNKVMWDSFTEKYLDATAYIEEEDYVACMATDITKQFEQEREKSKLHRTMLDSLPVGIVRLVFNAESKQFEIIYSNYAAQQIYGYEGKSEEFVYSCYKSRVYPADAEYVSQVFHKIQNGTQSVSFEY